MSTTPKPAPEVAQHTPVKHWRLVTNCGEDYPAFPALVYEGAQLIAMIATDQMGPETRDDYHAALIASAPTLQAENAALVAERNELHAMHQEQACVGESLRDTLARLRRAADNACAERDRLRIALARADSQFDLLAFYGLPGKSADLCFRSMKDIAIDAKRETSAALTGTTPAPASAAETVNEDLVEAATRLAARMENPENDPERVSTFVSNSFFYDDFKNALARAQLARPAGGAGK